MKSLLKLLFALFTILVIQIGSTNSYARSYILTFSCYSKKYSEHYFGQSIYFENFDFKSAKVDKRMKDIYKFIDLLASKHFAVVPFTNIWLYQCCELGTMAYTLPVNDSLYKVYNNLLDDISYVDYKYFMKYHEDISMVINKYDIVYIDIWECDLDYCLCKPAYAGSMNRYKQVLLIKKVLYINGAIDLDTKKDVVNWIKKSFAWWKIKNVVIN